MIEPEDPIERAYWRSARQLLQQLVDDGADEANAKGYEVAPQLRAALHRLANEAFDLGFAARAQYKDLLS